MRQNCSGRIPEKGFKEKQWGGGDNNVGKLLV